jgi:hypothetical protein
MNAKMMLGLVAATGVFGSTAALADPPVNLLTNPGFEDFTGLFASPPLIDGGDPTTWGHWTAFERWQSVDGVSSGFPQGWTGDNFAQQDPDLNNQFTDFTDQLRQAFDPNTALYDNQIPVGSVLTVKFVHINENRDGTVIINGLQSNEQWSEFAPWPCGVPPLFPPPPATVCDTLFQADLPSTAAWTPFEGSFTVSGTYSAIAIAFEMGGSPHDPSVSATTNARGVDNVSITITAVPVCHKPGTPAERTQLLPPSALRGHLLHGDTLGACEP